MARRLIPPPEDDLDEVDDELTKGIIYDQAMEEISEILSQAYADIEAKVALLVENLEDK